ncbi:glutaminase liver isoform, mitochondrial-like isoform X1 [Daphnia pulicaria]|uniref:glutaminase liver isoform, mitochondrial-like isoform X1 n=1 Tax=Daphnia pulicaria TaxID=35523 RepID=UPI001EECA448|nr:glutaminase liver isoform, mitochondrial-like isoform X1 [Daphnia pulicaria]XP_046647426.1 glutaminase liver isoform, mitochondrial-like isoform X1 [Daphnia pulicaria]
MSFGLGFLRVRSILSLVNNNAERVTCCLFIQKKWYSPSARDNRQQPNYIRQQVLHTSSGLQKTKAGIFSPIEEFGSTTTGEKDSSISVEDLLYDIFKHNDADHLVVGDFLAALWATGLRSTDPRLSELIQNLNKIQQDLGRDGPGNLDNLKLNREQFKASINENIVLISRAFRRQFVIPEFEEFTDKIEKFYFNCKAIDTGKVAAYIPQLERMSPNYWGVSLCTIDGQRFSIGDVKIPFTIQSCSKPLTYAIALNELGSEVVHRYVGQEPSGRMFNELILDHNKKPHNPMVNAGAILVLSLLLNLSEVDMSLAEKFDWVMNYFKRMSGGEFVGFNNAVFLSERENADRNYALAFYMRENKCFPEKINLRECLDFYFQCCSMEVDCESMSVIAATLANGGICPTTGDQVLKPDSVRDVLSLMHSCGMYDYSGQFAFTVGLPAKSGVCGGLLVVIPNVLGIALWSPPLDQSGNSVRGIEFCKELVSMFNFHRYDNLKHAVNKQDPRRHKYETKGLNIVSLLFSAAAGDVTAMRRYKLSGVDMTQTDYDNRTALHLAAAEGHLDCVDFLLKYCAVPPSPADRWGQTPKDEAVRFNHTAVAELIQSYIDKKPVAEEPVEDTKAKSKDQGSIGSIF